MDIEKVRQLCTTCKVEWTMHAATERVLHVVCAINADKLWIITTYEPDLVMWEADYVTRKGGA